MECPKCQTGNLTLSYLELFFCVQTCNGCGGNWVLIEDYVKWKDQHPEYAYIDVDVTEDLDDAVKALLCPSSGLIMRKLKIAKETSHRIDYSASVGGVWLDNGEWQLLKNSGLAGSLNTILTEHWQLKIREQRTEDTFDMLYRTKFGDEDYDKVKVLREWLQSHPQKSDLRAFLLAQDPYSVKR
ncbi:zf-TFIIB domain-containing protein [Aliiglaciecola sp. LCG003]|uniref:TFIIB-type zinc ribbon-containing protein n=1 Tax=Aliiglaciecola sp. LCG003 TaxID=3053655 RepID=UPI0025731F0A|nr:zf-TFIIB domain-containing protein [Aliiglaciecola sp. LCG003]WJG10039.1 zf-TFIIB domain-containing protein [Aliiglaciecola sp. LCG003]